MRVGDANRGWRFALSRRVDQMVSLGRGAGWSRLYCRSLADWLAVLQQQGFEVEVLDSQNGPPFANTLLVARVSPDKAFGSLEQALTQCSN